MRVTIDLNVILDFFLDRGQHQACLDVLSLCKEEAIIGSIPSHGLPTIYYILRKNIGHEKGLSAIEYVLQFLEVIPVDKKLLLQAMEEKFADFEDAVVAVSAVRNNSEFIITQNAKDFSASKIRAISAEQFMERMIEEEL